MKAGIRIHSGFVLPYDSSEEEDAFYLQERGLPPYFSDGYGGRWPSQEEADREARRSRSATGRTSGPIRHHL